MPPRVGTLTPRDVDYLKPKGRKDWLTLSEMSREVGCDPSWLRRLESQSRIPKAARIKRGGLNIRLWSPDQANEIKSIIAKHRPGRPANVA